MLKLIFLTELCGENIETLNHIKVDTEQEEIYFKSNSYFREVKHEGAEIQGEEI